MIQIICDDCEHEFFVDPSKAGGKVACPKCGDVNRIPALPVAREAGPVDDDEAAEDDVERLVVTLRPAMFRAHPLRFSTIVILVAGGIALELAASTMSTVPDWTL
ncbi:MAG: hypothetical protein KDA25_03185 [Phycisphaerales bacterium]|nr:hypothetical protein [Phycisphaerales bacterium]